MTDCPGGKTRFRLGTGPPVGVSADEGWDDESSDGRLEGIEDGNCEGCMLVLGGSDKVTEGELDGKLLGKELGSEDGTEVDGECELLGIWLGCDVGCCDIDGCAEGCDQEKT